MKNRQIVLDTETTGLKAKEGHRIIEIGAIELMERQLTGKKFHYYINPDREIDPGAQQVHGITNEFLADKPLFAEIIEELVDFIQGTSLIIHNAAFDVEFLNHEFCRSTKQGIKTIADYCSVIDTLKLARFKHPGQKNNLDALCKRYSIDNKDRNLHGALLDAQLLAQVYLAMTGGQNQLFVPPKTETKISSPTVLRKRKDPLKIISPSAAELTAHEALLDQMEAHYNQQVLWRKELEN